MRTVKNMRVLKCKKEADLKYLRDELTRSYRKILKEDTLESFVIAWADHKKGSSGVSYNSGFPDDLTRCLGMLERAKLQIIKRIDGGS